VRHAVGYLSLIGCEGELAIVALKRRLLLAAVALAVAWLALALAIVWLLAVTWDTPYRSWMIGGLCVLTGLSALFLARAAAQDRSELFARLRLEWAADREIIRGLTSEEDHRHG
jgi:uncharacterized membrane protein YqjE